MIAEALRLLRVYHRLSQAQLAAHFGISKSYLSEMESGKKKVTLDFLDRYASHFHIPLSALFLFTEELDGNRQGDRVNGIIALRALRLLNGIASGTGDCDEGAEKISD